MMQGYLDKMVSKHSNEQYPNTRVSVGHYVGQGYNNTILKQEEL